MRAVFRKAIILGALTVSAVAWSGCDAKKQTEYVSGISTQVTVPRDLKAVVVSVSVGGVPQFCRAYRVFDNGRVALPRSLGQFPSAGKPGADPITVTVVGFTEELTESTQNPVFNDCVFNVAKVNSNNARVLRRSRQPYVADEVLFLPMPLKFSCFDKDCGDNDDQTCKAGRCTTASIDQLALPRYTPDLVDGTGSACFPASECFAAAVPAVIVDSGDCTYAIPNTPSAPPLLAGAPPNPIMSTGEGVNVEITYDGGVTREILDKEALEGFTVPDPTKPQRFRLAPGLCDMVKGFDPQGAETPHRITAIRASGICRAKGPFQPLCANDQLAAMGTPDGLVGDPVKGLVCKATELKPAKSVLTILADDTRNNRVFYGSEGGTSSADVAQSDLVTAALADPAFRNTSIGLTFFPGTAPDAACTPHTPAVAPEIASTARVKIVKAFGDRKPSGATPSPLLRADDLEVNMRGALDDAYAALEAIPDPVNRRAVLVIGNRGFDTVTTCAGGGDPVDRATTARNVNKIDTYVGLFARDYALPANSPAPAKSDLVAAAGQVIPGQAGAGRWFDARVDKNSAQQGLRKIINDLATCAYDVAADPGADVVLSYSDPTALQKLVQTIKRDSSCTSDTVTTANGWGYNTTTKRVFVCGAACETYRSTLQTAAAYAGTYGQTSLAVPLFAHQAACAPK